MAGRSDTTAEVLLRLRRRREQSTRQAFERAAREAGEARRRLAKLRLLLAERHEAARRRLLEGDADTAAYRRLVTDTLAAIDDSAGRLVEAEQAASKRQYELLQARADRKALQCLTDRAARRREMGRRRAAARQSDDRHLFRVEAAGTEFNADENATRTD